jgi:predicted dinucleotide-binding enzyme
VPSSSQLSIDSCSRFLKAKTGLTKTIGEGNLKIGIIGTGNMGSALGLRWARNGHDVVFGSADRNKAKAIAAQGGEHARAGDLDEAAAFGEVLLYTVRDVRPSRLLRQPQVLAGKIVIDCNNSELPSDFRFDVPSPSLAERLATDIPDARVVKAFNTMAAQLIELNREALAPHQISVFLCSDDESAKRVVGTLAEELGFVAVDSGELERARLVESVADFIRFQIVGMGRGPFAAISVKVVGGVASLIL